MNKIKLSKEIKDYIDYMIEVVDGSSTDWFTIRRWLINIMPNEYRKLFSRRHNSIRKIILNDFDLTIIDYWKKQTDETLVIDYEKMVPEGYVSVSRSENMKRINEMKKQQRELEKNCK